MVVAVMIGLAQPVRLFLSRRRSIPRLRAARRWRMVLFTRNPPGDACLKGWLLFKHRRNTEGFRVSSKTTRRGQETSLIQGLVYGPGPEPRRTASTRLKAGQHERPATW